MKAVVLTKPCKASELQVTEVPTPQVKPGWVLVKIKAFGINRSELYTRQGFSPSVSLPRIIGIECVGEVVDPSDSSLHKGQRVVSLMGGLGREFDGSYAQYALIPKEQVYTVESSLDWALLAAVPETYYTAFGSLFESLHVARGETLLIRGGTSAAGLAALQIAVHAGLTVYATTRNEQKMTLLQRKGADAVFQDNGNLAADIREKCPGGANKVLELVGASTLRDSLKCVQTGGIVCVTGILGGWVLDTFDPIVDIPSGVCLTSFHSYAADQEKLDTLFAFLENKQIDISTPIVFPLEDIAKAHELMESNIGNSKIVILTS